MRRRINIFENSKSGLKSKAIELYRRGEKVSEIARQLQCTRETIYRWLRSSDKSLSATKPRSKKEWSPQVLHLVLEFYILLGAPSLRVLQVELLKSAQLQLSQAQLRLILKKRGVYEWEPSAHFNRLLREQVFQKAVEDTLAYKSSEKEIPPNALERLELPLLSNLPSAAGDSFGEGFEPKAYH
jgi:transposase-like protein